MRWDGLLLEFRFQYLDDFLCLFQLQVGTGGDLFDGQFQHAFGGVAAGGFQGFDDPSLITQPSISSANSVSATSSSSISR